MEHEYLRQLLSKQKQSTAPLSAVLVTVVAAQGSVPREVGAWMVVFEYEVLNTLGGGHLEWQAITHARQMLASKQMDAIQRYALGPSLGQCCGGVVHLKCECLSDHNFDQHYQALWHAAMLRAKPVALFGGGHVGGALVQLLGGLPCSVLWVDSRDSIFPQQLPANVRCENASPIQDAVADVPTNAHVLIMSFSHAEDLDVVAACLQRQRLKGDLNFIGLIGSASKWASFRQRLMQRGFDEKLLTQVTCPIGLPAIGGKTPQEIAISVAAQFLQHVYKHAA